jgi:hypothetical protein
MRRYLLILPHDERLMLDKSLNLQLFLHRLINRLCVVRDLSLRSPDKTQSSSTGFAKIESGEGRARDTLATRDNESVLGQSMMSTSMLHL